MLASVTYNLLIHKLNCISTKTLFMDILLINYQVSTQLSILFIKPILVSTARTLMYTDDLQIC